jgi:hypothetical protein
MDISIAQPQSARTRSRLALRAGLSTAAVYLTTAVHHIYGGTIYSTDWRVHGTLGGLPLLLVTIGTLVWYQRSGSRAALSIYGLLSVLWVGVIGLWEGGYNHLFKNLLFFGGASLDTMHRFFPTAIYDVLPNDVFFESTGILTLAVGLVAGWHTLRLFQQRHMS